MAKRTNITKAIQTGIRVSITKTTIASSKANPRKSRQPARLKTKFFSPAKPAPRVAVALLLKNFNRAIPLASAVAAARAPASSAHSAAAAAETAVAAAIAADVPIADAVDAAVSIVAAAPDTAVAAIAIKAASAVIVATAARSAVLN